MNSVFLLILYHFFHYFICFDTQIHSKDDYTSVGDRITTLGISIGLNDELLRSQLWSVTLIMIITVCLCSGF